MRSWTDFNRRELPNRRSYPEHKERPLFDNSARNFYRLLIWEYCSCATSKIFAKCNKAEFCFVNAINAFDAIKNYVSWRDHNVRRI